MSPFSSNPFPPDPADPSEPSAATDPAVTAWSRLACAYRKTRIPRAEEDEAAPYGFASRVVAQIMERRRHQHLAWWTRWSLAAAGAASLLAVIMAVRSPEGAAVRFDSPGFTSPSTSSTSSPLSNSASAAASVSGQLLPGVPALELPRLSPP